MIYWISLFFIEWVYSSNGEINAEILERPSTEFLEKNGHKLIFNLKINYISLIFFKSNNLGDKISKFYQVDSLMFIGFEDGLIMIWSQKVSLNFLSS